ncbi:hypothetical protein [Sphingorhabdus sp. EL138]|uniref:hypothetical protein n=1 Tax=Sphingorhabdus sp. EL138 TaxID=2073156 RepID=UPI0025F184ED|nr:hypothetical protein [Sphingorhabdus sp. EL138]
MITIIATAMLSMAAMKGDPMDNARKAFNNCMIEVHNVAVAEKAAPSAFIQTSDSACPTERAAYKAILVKSERSYGSSLAEAEKFAAEEIQLLVDSVVTSFNENIESGAKLTPEK